MSDGHHDHHEEAVPGAESGFYARRVRAMEALPVEKGVLTREDVRRQVEDAEARSPENGARLVARAWPNAGFKTLLLTDLSISVARGSVFGPPPTG